MEVTPAHTDSSDRPSKVSWDPQLYLRFPEHRIRPALELLDRVSFDTPPAVVYDLGCGPGTLTRVLTERFPGAEVHGVDSSPEMLRTAAEAAPTAHLHQVEISSWRPRQRPDLVFANSLFHLVPDHGDLLRRMVRDLTPRGVLAAQMPVFHRTPWFRLMTQTLEDGGRGGTPLGAPGLRRTLYRRHTVEAMGYYDLLAGPNTEVDIWSTEYLHVLDGPDPVWAWAEAAGLRPVIDGLTAAEFAEFRTTYLERLRAAYPPLPDGRTLFPFQRLFLVVHSA
ncbi:methyltransferase domain-containing protein [Streptomyces phaeolivaceus]|uniref:methyltransferase domain-containing protein n=1 Tax=Streptomyces phaeolivaceus TaxID=2653200 RepID=UPI00299F862E|nr:methyltransferase domain-containing protein [Streptomyces phaeolivaceus]